MPSTPDVPARRPADRLLRILGVAFGLAVIVGNSIGVGILRTPGDIATQLPQTSWFLLVWLGGGIYALLGALTLAELGAMVPESGGQYVFVRRALGDYAGFSVGWSDWFSCAASIAAVTVGVGEYSEQLLPALRGYSVGIAVFVIVVLTLIQATGIRSGDLTQRIITLAKAFVLVGLAAVCLFAPVPAAAPAAVTSAGAVPVLTMAAIVVALQGVIFTYDGWNGMLYFSGEVPNPGRDIPRAMAGGVVTVIVIYLLLNLAFLRLVPIQQMAGEPLVAAAAARAIFGPTGDTIIRSIIILSLVSAANAIILCTCRLPYGLSRDGYVWSGFGRVTGSGVPMASLLLSSGTALVLILSGTFNQLLALAAFFFVFNYTLSFTSVLVLRRTEPATPRPYRAWGYPWVPVLLLVGSLAFLVGNVVTDTLNSLVSMGLLALSYPLFRSYRRKVGVVRAVGVDQA